MDYFCGREAPEKRDFSNIFVIFQIHLFSLRWRHKKMESQAGRTDFSFSFHQCKLFSLTYFQSPKWAFQNIFSFLCPLAPGKRICYDSHSACRWVQPWHNTKAQRVGLHRVPPATDTAQTSMTPPWFWFFVVLERFLTYLIKSSVGP